MDIGGGEKGRQILERNGLRARHGNVCTVQPLLDRRNVFARGTEPESETASAIVVMTDETLDNGVDLMGDGIISGIKKDRMSRQRGRRARRPFASCHWYRGAIALEDYAIGGYATGNE
jgi:hypothetical protein